MSTIVGRATRTAVAGIGLLACVGAAAPTAPFSYRPSGDGSTKAQYLWSPASHWTKPIRWRYNHAGAPLLWANRKYELILAAFEAIRMWTLVCGVEAIYDGETSIPPTWQAPDGVNVLGWVDTGSFEGEAEVWVTAGEGADAAIIDADIVLNNASYWFPAAAAKVRTLLAHEWGHALGLAHSDVAGVVMSGQPYTPYNDVATLQQDDIDGCRAMYGEPRAAAAALPVLVEAIEFYRPDIDHYFVTHDAEEIAALDDGRRAGWVRTGMSIKLLSAPLGDTSSLCRIYLPPGIGDSHFYGRDARECASVVAGMPGVVVESSAFLHAFLPENGVCRDQTSPIYRVWSNRADVNHRYTTSRAERDLMVSFGWEAEGDGPDAVTLCAPE